MIAMDPRTPAGDTTPRSARWRAVAVLAVLGFVLLNLPGLASYPPVHDDEAWFACSAYDLAKNGRLGCSLFRDSTLMLRMDERTYWQPPLYFVVLAGAQRLFGHGLLVGRLLSLVAGAGLLLALGFAASKLWNDARVAALAMALAALDPFFLLASRTGRMDILAALCSFAAMTWLARPGEGAAAHRRAALAGCSVAFAFTLHPAGLIAAAAAWAVVAFRLARRPGAGNTRPSPRALVLFAAPQVLAAVLWGAWALRDPEAFIAQFGRNCLRSHGTGLSFQSLRLELLERYWDNYGPERFPLLLLFLGATAWLAVSRLALRRGAPGQRIACWFAAAYAAGFAFAAGSKTPYHLAHLIPYFAMFGSVAVMALWDLRGRLGRPVAAAIAASALLVEAGHVARIARMVERAGPEMDFEAFTGRVFETVPRGSTVLGSAALWFALEPAGITLLDDPMMRPGEARLETVEYAVILPSYFPRNELFARLWQRPGENLSDRPQALRAWIDQRGAKLAEVGSDEHPLNYQAVLLKIGSPAGPVPPEPSRR